MVYALTLNDAVQPPEFRARQSFVNDWILDRERSPDEAAPSRHGCACFDFVSQRIDAWRVGRATTEPGTSTCGATATRDGARRGSGCEP